MRQKIEKYGLLVLMMLFYASISVTAQENSPMQEELNVKELILDHLSDSYDWQIVNNGQWDITLSLPVILYSKTSGWHFFLSDRVSHGSSFNGFRISAESSYKGKIVETATSGVVSRPLDLSMTRNACSLLLSSFVLILMVLGVARVMKRKPMEGQGGFVGMMELFIQMICDDVIKPAVGKDYQRYTSFLLTIFFFIFINNLLGLVPFPGWSQHYRQYCRDSRAGCHHFPGGEPHRNESLLQGNFLARCAVMAEGAAAHYAGHRVRESVYQTFCIDDPSLCKYHGRACDCAGTHHHHFHDGEPRQHHQHIHDSRFRDFHDFHLFCGAAGGLYPGLCIHTSLCGLHRSCTGEKQGGK